MMMEIQNLQTTFPPERKKMKDLHKTGSRYCTELVLDI